MLRRRTCVVPDVSLSIMFRVPVTQVNMPPAGFVAASGERCFPDFVVILHRRSLDNSFVFTLTRLRHDSFPHQNMYASSDNPSGEVGV